MIGFNPQGHQYFSLDGSNQKWLGVTTLVGSFKQKFDSTTQAPKSARNKKSKWYGMNPADILATWESEGKRSIDLGHWYHSKIEDQILSNDTIDGLKVHRPIIQEGIKVAPSQKLEDGIYPEHLVYLQSAGLSGQVDKVTVKDGYVHIEDHKTNKEIKRQGYTNWEGVTTKMLKPVQHLDECEFNSYALQLSLYMYMILRHNSLLQAGDIKVNHVRLKELSQDKFGYPIYEQDSNGDYIVESIGVIEIPYLKTEVQNIIAWLKSK